MHYDSRKRSTLSNDKDEPFIFFLTLALKRRTQANETYNLQFEAKRSVL